MTKQAPPTPMLPKIEPPDGYKVRTQWGLLRSDGTDAGRLVRLADLVLWMMDTQELPCGEAVDLVCGVLESKAAIPLFMVDETGWAKPLDVANRFDYQPVTIGGSGFWESFAEPSKANPSDCGVAGAIRGMRRFWTTTPDCSVYEAVGLECLATPLRIAFEVWGYGEVVAPAADVHSLVLVPVATPVSEPAHDEWDGARLLARRDELKGQGVRKFNPELQMLSGLGDREIRRRISAVEKGWAAAPATPFSGLGATTARSR